MPLGVPLTTTLPVVGVTVGPTWATLNSARHEEVRAILEAGAVTGADVKHGAREVLMSASLAMTNLGQAVAVKTADQISTVTGHADVTDLQFAIAASTVYSFEFFVVFQTAATTTGIDLSINGPASPTDVTWYDQIMLSGAAGTAGVETKAQIALDATHITASIDAANTNRCAVLRGMIRNGVNAGTLTLRFATEVGASSVTIKQGSWARLSRIGTPTWNGGQDQFWLSGSAGDDVTFPLPLAVGQQVTAVKLRGRANGTQTWTLALYQRQDTTNTITQLGSTQTSTTTATDSVLTVSPTPFTVTTGFEYFAVWTANGIACRCYNGSVMIQRP